MIQWRSFGPGREVEAAQAGASTASLERFRNAFGLFLGVEAKAVHLMPSGHQGLEWLLKSRSESRRKVLVPAFNCSVVQEAIEGAGYEPDLYDFSPEPGRFDWDQIIAAMDDSVGTLIVTHYFGVPTDFRPILKACEEHGITVIEDCAHTLGGMVAGQQAGTLGDAAIFSFNYDKPISLAWGGIAVINRSSLFDQIQPIKYRTPSVDEEMRLLLDFAATMRMRRRMIPYQNALMVRILRRARLVRVRPFRKDPDLSMGALQAELGVWCLARYPDVQRKRLNNARHLAANVCQPTWPVAAEVQPAWLKQKYFNRDDATSVRISSRLQRLGIRAGNFNWPRLIDGQGRELCPQACRAAARWMDVPIHQNLSKDFMEIMIRVLNDV